MKILFVILWLIFEVFCVIFPERVSTKWDWVYWNDKISNKNKTRNTMIRIMHTIILLILIFTITSIIYKKQI